MTGAEKFRVVSYSADRRRTLCHRAAEIVQERAADVRADLPAAPVGDVLAPLPQRLQRRLGQRELLRVGPVARDDRDRELVAVPVVSGAIAVDADEQRSVLREHLASGTFLWIRVASHGGKRNPRACRGDDTVGDSHSFGEIDQQRVCSYSIVTAGGYLVLAG